MCVSHCRTPKEKTSKFVDFYLQPIVRTLPNAIKDTTEFLCKLRNLGDIPENPIISTMDVVALYKHTPHSEGLGSLRKVMHEYHMSVGLGKLVPVGELVELARLILENCYFNFEDKIYHKIFGTAIDTKFVPSFANSFYVNVGRENLDRISPETFGVVGVPLQCFFSLGSMEGKLR